MVLIFKKIIPFLDNIQKYQLFVGFFIYSAIISLFIQFILLPYILPEMHYVNGIMHHVDSVSYHLRASVIANNISEIGWEVWDFTIDGWGITGLVSLHYGIFGINHPSLLVPLYSALHALGALCIVIVIERINDNRSIAILAAIPYLIFPSSLLWVSQILKDVFTLNSSLFILCGLVLLIGFSEVEDIKVKIKKQILASILIIAGLLIIWWIRPYMLTVYFAFIFAILFLLNISLIISFIKHKITIQEFIRLILVQFFIILVINALQNQSKNHTGVIGTLVFADENDSVRNSVSFEQVKKNIKEASDFELKALKTEIKIKKSTLATKSLNSQSLDDRRPEVAILNSEQVLQSEELPLIVIPKLISEQVLQPEEILSKTNILVDEILITMPSKPLARRGLIVKKLGQYPVKVRILPGMSDLAQGNVSADDLLKEIELLEQRLSKKNDEALSPEQKVSDFDSIYENRYIHKVWEKTKFLPGAIDFALSRLYHNRSYFYQIAHTYESTFDVDTYVNNFSAMLRYSPRALQIGFLSPFPVKWFSSSSSVMPSLFTKIIGVETAINYIFILGFVFSLYIWRKKIELWVLMSFSIYFALIPVYAFPNFGAIIRYRYSALMLAVALGIAAFHYLYTRRLSTIKHD